MAEELLKPEPTAEGELWKAVRLLKAMCLQRAIVTFLDDCLLPRFKRIHLEQSVVVLEDMINYGMADTLANSAEVLKKLKEERQKGETA